VRVIIFIKLSNSLVSFYYFLSNGIVSLFSPEKELFSNLQEVALGKMAADE
jgi:hypothetical protein